ncbi:hypothetical protein [Flexivirga caeni]|uniref:hypothetical protein n=1 Tax=Flexivirga caeni TaxID=2294115 RepID=UPI0011CD7AEA|nr:hypothetical protein [Flexivirga caeni]
MTTAEPGETTGITIKDLQHHWVSGTPLDLRNSPQEARELDPDHLRQVLLDPDLRPDPRGLNIYGAHLTGPLNLDECTIRTSLRLPHLTANHPIRLSGAHITGQLDLSGATLTGQERRIDLRVDIGGHDRHSLEDRLARSVGQPAGGGALGAAVADAEQACVVATVSKVRKV